MNFYIISQSKKFKKYFTGKAMRALNIFHIILHFGIEAQQVIGMGA